MAKRNDQDIISDLEKKILPNRSSRDEYEQSWLLNYLFFCGFQWVDSAGGTVRNFNNDVRFRANKIRIGVTHSVAKAMSNPPDFDVENEASDSESTSSANVAEKFLEYVWRAEGLQIKTKEWAISARINGDAHAYVLWDPSRGETVDPKSVFYPAEDGSRMDMDGLYESFNGDEKNALAFLKGEFLLKKGAVTVDIVDPMDFFHDESGTDERSCRWMCVSRLRSKDDVSDRFDVDKDKLVGASAGDVFLSQYKLLKMQFVSPNATPVAGMMDCEDLVNLVEYWERPSKEYPRGRLVIFGGGIVFVDDENPFAGMDCELPFVRMRDIIIPNRYHGAAAVEDAIAPQRDYNKARSDMIKERLNNAISKWLVPAGSQIPDGALNRNTDEVVTYSPVSLATGQPLRPERMPPGPSSPLHSESMALAQSEIDEVFGISDVSRGQSPTGVYSGVQLGMTIEEGDTRIGSFRDELYSAISKLGKYILDICSRFITEPRTFTEIMGDNALGEVMTFIGDDLASKRVEVRVGSMSARRRAARQQSIMELLQYGGPEFFKDYETRRALVAAVGLSPNMYDPGEVHCKRARFENEMLRKGMIDKAYVTPYQDHLKHLYEHYQEMNSLDFDNYPPEVQDAFMQHAMMHEQLRAMIPMLPPNGQEQEQVEQSKTGKSPEKKEESVESERE